MNIKERSLVWVPGIFASMLSILPFSVAVAYDGVSCSKGVYSHYNLWGPHGDFDPKWMATKWKRPIRLVFDDFTGGSEASENLKHELLDEAAQLSAATGISIGTEPPNGNVLVVISNDIAASDLRVSELERNLLINSMGPGGAVDASLSSIHRDLAAMNPRCGGFVAFNTKDGIVGAFLFLQPGQDKRCVPVALAELLGIGNSWTKVAGQKLEQPDIEKIKTDISEAAHEKYDPKIIHGMDKSQVEEVMKEQCK